MLGTELHLPRSCRSQAVLILVSLVLRLLLLLGRLLRLVTFERWQRAIRRGLGREFFVSLCEIKQAVTNLLAYGLFSRVTTAFCFAKERLARTGHVRDICRMPYQSTAIDYVPASYGVLPTRVRSSP